MAEVFEGTPSIVNVAISDQEGKKVEYNVCGRELTVVADAVRSALSGIPDEASAQKNKPAPKRKRRTKAEMAGAVSGDGDAKVWPQ